MFRSEGRGFKPRIIAPTHFSIVVGSALVCTDQVNSDYFNEYMQRYFGKPSQVWGGANWWKVEEKLFNSEVQYIIGGLGQDFIGATFKDIPENLATKQKGYLGMNFRQMEAEKWVSATSGIIIRYYDQNTPSKLYCMGSPHSPVSY